jgi:hypothetical protein
MLDDWRIVQDTVTAAPEPYHIHLVLCVDTEGIDERIDPWQALQGLKLQPEDKTYFHGFLNALQLPRPLAYQLLATYRQTYERALKRGTNPNGLHHAGLQAANRWLLAGAQGFIQREAFYKLD